MKRKYLKTTNKQRFGNMKRGFGRDTSAADVLLDPGMLKTSVKFGSERNLSESSFSELVFETVGKQNKKKNREHRLTLPSIHLPVENSQAPSPKNGDSGDKKKVPTMTLDDGVNKVTLSPPDNGSGGSSKIVRSPSFRRKKAASEQPPPEYNIVLLGALGVGKTGTIFFSYQRKYVCIFGSRFMLYFMCSSTYALLNSLSAHSKFEDVISDSFYVLIFNALILYIFFLPIQNCSFLQGEC